MRDGLAAIVTHWAGSPAATGVGLQGRGHKFIGDRRGEDFRLVGEGSRAGSIVAAPARGTGPGMTFILPMLLLHDVLRHDLNEVAEITAVSVSAAQSRLVRGRKDFQRRTSGKARR